MTARELEVFRLIQANPMISQEEIAKQLSISRSAVSVHISSLLRQGALKGRGYVVNEEEYDVVIGTAGVDILGLIDAELSDSVNDKILNHMGRISVRFGGAAHNISEYLIRLGGKVRLMSAISADIFGRQIVDRCMELGINVDECLFLHDEPQSLMLQFRDTRNDKYFSLVNYNTESQMTPEFFNSKSKMLANAKNLVITDIVSSEAMDYLLTQERPESWCIFSGVISRIDRLKAFIPRIDHIYLNLRAAAHVTGSSEKDDKQTVAARLLELGAKDVFLSCDERHILHVDGKNLTQYDTLAGARSGTERGKDAFVAGLLYTHNGSRSMTDRILFSSACSLLALGSDSPEAYALSIDAVDSLLEAASS